MRLRKDLAPPPLTYSQALRVCLARAWGRGSGFVLLQLALEPLVRVKTYRLLCERPSGYLIIIIGCCVTERCPTPLPLPVSQGIFYPPQRAVANIVIKTMPPTRRYSLTVRSKSLPWSFACPSPKPT